MRTVDTRDVHPSRPLSRQLDLNLVELFDAVYRARNLTAAGSELGLTQPAVSRGLAKLRETYGDALFVRQQRGVTPTPFADALAAPIASALQVLRSTIYRPTFVLETEARAFRVAMSDVGERLFLPRLACFLAKEAPNLTVEAVSLHPKELNDALASGQIDLAVGFLGALSKQLYQRTLFHEHFVYIARRDHPSVSSSLKLDQLRALSHVVAGSEGMLYAEAVAKVLESSRVRAKVALRVHSFLCVAPIVAETELIGVVPSNLAATVADHIPLRLLDPPVKFPGFDVTLTWHQRFHQDPGNESLRAIFIRLFEALRVPPSS
jgi:DNA-binding transcriptional LysR family regulator